MHAALYARKSTEQRGVSPDAKSVTRQIANARAYALRKGWTIDDAHVYSDDGISGAEFKRRPGLQRLLHAALVPRPPFAALIVSEQESLGREMVETQWTIKQLAEAGVEVHAYMDERCLTPTGWLDKAMSAMRGAADEAHREDTAKRVHEAHAQRARQGTASVDACSATATSM